MMHLDVIYASMFVSGLFVGAVTGILSQAVPKSYLIDADPAKMTFQLPLANVLFCASLCVAIIGGLGFEVVTPSQPIAPYVIPLIVGIVGPPLLAWAWFLGPDRLTIDIETKQYVRIRSWIRVKKTGPLSDISCVQVKTVAGQSYTQYFCKLEWASGKTMRIGRFGKIEEAEEMANQVSTVLNLPIVHKTQ